MKCLSVVVLTALLLTSSSSCIVLSTKKYNALIADKDSIQSRLNESEITNSNFEAQVARLKADTSRLFANIARLKSDTAGLNSSIARLKEEIETINSNYASLRTNTSSEITKLADDLKVREARIKEVEEILRKRDEATNALKDKLQKALLGFQKSGLSVDIRNGKVYVSLTDKLLFDTGSIIIDDKGKQALQELARVLKTQPEINISVEGHTDNQRVANLGQIKDNWDLSVLRATSVVRYLTEVQKIENNRITATGKGEYQPIDKASSTDARSRNRRIEIVLSPKLDELYQLIK